MRSLEWATSERNRASLWRRCRSSASEAPSRASDTCEASDSSESTSSRGMRDWRAEDEQAARLVADRQSGRRSTSWPLVEAELAPHVLGHAASAELLAGPADSRSQALAPPSRAASRRSSPEEAATSVPSLARAGRGGRRPGARRGRGRPRSLPRCTCSRPAAATSSTPARRSASSREAARSSWRTRPTMRATTSRKRTAEATISTSRSVSPNACQTRMPGAIRHARGEQREAQWRQPGAGLERGLLERAHRRVQRGRAPEQVEGDPADVVAQLVVVRAREQRVGVGRVDGEQGDDAADEEVEGRRALAVVDREPDRGGEEQDVAERVGGRDGLLEQRQAGEVDVRGDEEDPREQGDADRDDQRVDHAGAVALRVSAPDEDEQAGHERPGRRSGRWRRRSTGTPPRRRSASGSCTCRGRRRRRGSGRR